MIITYDGSVGAGKTTLINESFSKERALVLFEPFSKEELNGVFEKALSPFEFQIRLIQRKNDWLEKNFYQTEVIVLDRSFYGDWIMAFYYFLQKKISHEEWKEYTQLSTLYQNRWGSFIFSHYLRVSPEECYSRYLHREGSNSPAPYTLEDFQVWRDLHEKAFITKELGFRFTHEVFIHE